MAAHAYIDGLNLYYGTMRTLSMTAVNLEGMCAGLWEQAEFTRINFFTSMRRGAPGDRQAAFHSALERYCKTVDIIYGSLQPRERACTVSDCEFQGSRAFCSYEEKRTDVNIAVKMLRDAHTNSCDKMLLISGDSDLMPALEMINDFFPSITVRVYAPGQIQDKLTINEMKDLGVVERAGRLPYDVLVHNRFPPASDAVTAG